MALAGKTEGTGFHDDWGRVLADVALRGWTAASWASPSTGRQARHLRPLRRLPGRDHPAHRRGHARVVDVDELRPRTTSASWSASPGSEAILPEDIGRVSMMRKVATAVHAAMADAGIDDPKDVHLAMVKVPGLTTACIKDAESRGHTVVTRDLTFGPEGAGRSRTTPPRSASPSR